MTKEELEKEARINLKRRFGEFFPQLTISYVMGAEPREKRIEELEKENAELKKQLEMSNKVYNDNLDYSQHIEEQLTKAKKVIEELYNIIPASMSDYAKEPMEHARKFMTEE